MPETSRKAYKAAYQRSHRKERNEANGRWRAKHPEKALLKQARERARKKGIPFTIQATDIVIPEVCPILGIPILVKEHTAGDNTASPNSPSLDRIDSSKGYVRGNVWVISWRANHIKTDATLEELERLVSTMRAKLT